MGENSPETMNARRLLPLLALPLLLMPGPSRSAGRKPLALHPENPHYFRFRGKPAVLVTSGEHYGAVLNRDFDYLRYLDALRADGLNLTRTFSGAYVEPVGAFKIDRNTLAPLPGRFICPWARSETPGYANGGARFDLSRWDDEYFRRLRDFVSQADRRGIIVELNLFCPFYEDAQWKLSPLNAANNIQGLGTVARTEVWTLKHPELLRVQEAMVRKIVAELRPYDNVYYEICNEPYFGGVSADWQRRVSEWIVDAEGGPAAADRHLISENVANGAKKVEDPNPNVSIFNFHYGSPPRAVEQNYGLNRVVGCNETGFKGTGGTWYRQEGWDFLLAGGALYNNLDYSFTADTPDGTAVVKDPTPGGGGPALRAQLRVLKQFMERLPFLRMRPAPEVYRGGLPEGASARVLAEPGKVYALYLRRGAGPARLRLSVPPGRYRGEWVTPATGAAEPLTVEAAGGETVLETPPYQDDLALRLTRR